MELSSLLHLLEQDPFLCSISLEKLITFIRYTIIARPTIDISIPNTDFPPPRLPWSVQVLLARLLGEQVSTIQHLWASFKDVIWRSTETIEPSMDEITWYNKHALNLRMSYNHIYPPTRVCLQYRCQKYRSANNVKTLEDPLTHTATLYTLRHGTLPIYTTSLYCTKCHRRYYHNYSVHKASNIREYYGGVPSIIQVAQHFFIDSALLEFFSSSKVFGWLSSSNCARIYNNALANAHSEVLNNQLAYPGELYRQFKPKIEWNPSLELQDTHVLNGFFLYNLLIEKSEQRSLLVLEHDAPSQKDRLKPALQEQNEMREGIGQEEYTHACDLCFLVSENEQGEKVKLQPAVCDGVTIGHPCCAVHDCHTPLISNRNRFCEDHQDLNFKCSEMACQELREPGFRTCQNPQHRLLETRYFRKDKAIVLLRERLKAVAVPVHSVPVNANPLEDVDALLDQEDEVEVQGQEVSDKCGMKPEVGNRRLKAYFGRRRTHNEQLMMRPCGVILSRATFFGSESLTSVKDFAKATFPTPQSTPEILVFDTNCGLDAHLKSTQDDHFKNTGLPVDVFHFRTKHKETDTHCQIYCNPAAFPELLSDGKWTINMSICEQTNAWIGGYQAILRDMEATRFNYYLDIMIKRRNRYVVQQLARKGHCPWKVSLDMIFPPA